MSMVLPSDLRHKINAPSRVTLPDELIAEILSRLNVKSLTQLKCVSKSWNSIISDCFFVKMHLDKSSRIPQIMLFSSHNINSSKFVSLHSLPIHCLLENPSINIFKEDSKYQLMKWRHPYRVIGSCNGLICFHNDRNQKPFENRFYLWNPATTPFSENLDSFHLRFRNNKFFFRFSFGYDNLTNKYKLLAFTSKEVRVFTFGDNVWKNIQGFPVDPYYSGDNQSVYLSNSLNWFALLNKNGFQSEDLKVEQFVIISLDLGTETYTQFPFPREFDEVPPFVPIVCVLMDCLCFSHYTKEHSFVILQMREFGVENSWTKLLKFDYHSLFDCYTLHDCSKFVNLLPLPLHVFENGDILILARHVGQLICYNRRDNMVVSKTISTNNIYLSSVIPYVESLVSTF